MSTLEFRLDIPGELHKGPGNQIKNSAWRCLVSSFWAQDNQVIKMYKLYY